MGGQSCLVLSDSNINGEYVLVWMEIKCVKSVNLVLWETRWRKGDRTALNILVPQNISEPRIELELNQWM